MMPKTNISTGAVAALIETCVVGSDVTIAGPSDRLTPDCRGRSRCVAVSPEERLDEPVSKMKAAAC